MIKISQIIDAAASLMAEEGMTVYKTACPTDFSRPSLYILATVEDITFDIGKVINVKTKLTATTYVELDEKGDASAKDITDAAERISNALAAAGGISVGDYFLKAEKVKNKVFKDSLKTTVKLSYNDIADFEENQYDLADEVRMGSYIEEG